MNLRHRTLAAILASGTLLSGAFAFLSRPDATAASLLDALQRTCSHAVDLFERAESKVQKLDVGEARWLATLGLSLVTTGEQLSRDKCLENADPAQLASLVGLLPLLQSRFEAILESTAEAPEGSGTGNGGPHAPGDGGAGGGPIAGGGTIRGGGGGSTQRRIEDMTTFLAAAERLSPRQLRGFASSANALRALRLLESLPETPGRALDIAPFSPELERELIRSRTEIERLRDRSLRDFPGAGGPIRNGR